MKESSAISKQDFSLDSIALVSTTLSDSTHAERLATDLIESRLAACVQMDGPVRSIYRWQGKTCIEQEYRLVCKTVSSLVEALIRYIKQNHPYDLPEIIVANYECTSEYAQWLKEQVG